MQCCCSAFLSAEAEKQGKTEIAIITGKGKRRVVRLDTGKITMQGIEHALEEIAKAVEEVLGRKAGKPKLIMPAAS